MDLLKMWALFTVAWFGALCFWPDCNMSTITESLEEIQPIQYLDNTISFKEVELV